MALQLCEHHPSVAQTSADPRWQGLQLLSSPTLLIPLPLWPALGTSFCLLLLPFSWGCSAGPDDGALVVWPTEDSFAPNVAMCAGIPCTTTPLCSLSQHVLLRLQSPSMLWDSLRFHLGFPSLLQRLNLHHESTWLWHTFKCSTAQGWITVLGWSTVTALGGCWVHCRCMQRDKCRLGRTPACKWCRIQPQSS